ncbi:MULTISPECIES: short-chain fatty acid transporter [Pseudothermotoga]|jgi:short-chain fatty acids transporter|uniref:Short chain fatty acid transporter n=1 Tax=Pseudothermotoga lettingae (strain ATCC BAA-301 / DSM 14385 / NBRC 107922 / TMO) TaxID=416591 RepID=A8F7H9_PSELT|nr:MULTISPECIES: TIGR00366 family protein [Pseudothermotoga]ABV34113.1 short chain fatty acid transporter [Pseudothermotoga lettingae TMO]MDK2884740.1 short-chain fatty acid transporter [Pseudothermotoga sp.]MDN5338822.1 short-chain fatty acid transporter [Thermotogaceae bacterium]GLI48945.1 short-chain fatty acids transporter [Pseudothermotoga lettingae TMO]
MLRVLGSAFSRFAKKWLPDALIFAIILTLLTFVLGMLIQHKSPIDMIRYMGDGFWNLLSFAMQMCLVLMTGHILAQTKPMAAILRTIAKAANTPFKAVALACVVMIITSYLNWGFGLIFTSLLAIEIAKNMKGKGLHYPLLVASAYSGFLVWHAGLSASAPLLVNTKGHFLEKQIGLIPVSQTIFSPVGYVPVLVLLFTLPFIMAGMHPKKEEVIEVDPSVFAEKKEIAKKKWSDMTPAEKMENSPVLSLIIGLIGLVYIFYYFFVKGGSLDLNILNFIFLMIGLLLHGTPKNFINAAIEAGKTVWGVVIQFPFYAGIMGMMINSGLAATIANWFASFSTARTLPLFSYWSAGLINLFVPSGGGQWSVQGPIMTQAAQQIGASIPKVVMGVAWGDAWTNMIQPFWALPLLSVAKLDIRDIMGYCVMALIWSGVVTSLLILIL